jgi:hypothetical protein
MSAFIGLLFDFTFDRLLSEIEMRGHAATVSVLGYRKPPGVISGDLRVTLHTRHRCSKPSHLLL